MTNLRILTMLLGLALVATACNFGPGDGRGDDDDAGVDPVETDIAALNAGEYANGTLVTVRGVITTPFDIEDDDDDNEARFWIQDGSGPGSGIQIFTFPDVAEALDDADVWAGTAVEVTGVFDEPFDFKQIRVTSADSVVSQGDGEMPDAHPIAAADIEGGFAPADLVGVLVELTDVTADSAGGWDNYWEWEADGAIIDSLYYYVDVNPGTAVDSLKGVLFLDFGNAVVAPRWGGDVDFTYAGCDTAADGVLKQINCREVFENDDVEATGLVVVSPAPWFSDSAFFAVDPAGDLFAGIEIYSWADAPAPAIGAVVDVSGEYEEYRGQSEIVVQEDSQITDTGDTADVPVLDLADACVSEQHEGMLVRIATLDVTQDSDGNNFGYYTVEGCTNVVVGSDFFDDSDAFNAATGGAGTITDLVGVVTDELDTYNINPRSTDDWASWE